MTTTDTFTHTEIDERAFAIFMIEGIYYYLDQDPPLQEGSIIGYCHRLWLRWQQMDRNEKTSFWDRALEELRRLRRFQRADIYRSVMRDNIPDNDDTPHRRRRHEFS